MVRMEMQAVQLMKAVVEISSRIVLMKGLVHFRMLVADKLRIALFANTTMSFILLSTREKRLCS